MSPPLCDLCGHAWLEKDAADPNTKWEQTAWDDAWDSGLCPYCAWRLCRNCDNVYLHHVNNKCLFDSTVFVERINDWVTK